MAPAVPTSDTPAGRRRLQPSYAQVTSGDGSMLTGQGWVPELWPTCQAIQAGSISSGKTIIQ